jgi:hypothetical protein
VDQGMPGILWAFGRPAPVLVHLRKIKIAATKLRYAPAFPTLLYRCPDTGLNVQGWPADDGAANEGEVYEAMTCPGEYARGASGEPGDRQGLWGLIGRCISLTKRLLVVVTNDLDAAFCPA